MRNSGFVLQVGLEGRDVHGNMVMPTTWASLTTIEKGAISDIPGAPDSGADTPSGNGAIIDDSVVSTKTVWSSKNTVDKLCPAFTKSGTVVACEPVEGYPLTVTGGDVIARCGKNLYNESNTVKGEQIYADSDDTKGETRFGVVVYLPKGKYTIHAERTATEDYSNDYIYVVVLERQTNINLSTSSVKPVQKGNTYAVQVELDYDQCLFFYNGLTTKATLDNTVELFGRYNLQIEVGDAATPWEPFTGIESLDGLNPLPASAGVNTMWHQIGNNEITVTGRTDPNATIAKLEYRLAALEKAMINT